MLEGIVLSKSDSSKMMDKMLDDMKKENDKAREKAKKALGK